VERQAVCCFDSWHVWQSGSLLRAAAGRRQQEQAVAVSAVGQPTTLTAWMHPSSADRLEAGWEHGYPFRTFCGAIDGTSASHHTPSHASLRSHRIASRIPHPFATHTKPIH